MFDRLASSSTCIESERLTFSCFSILDFILSTSILELDNLALENTVTMGSSYTTGSTWDYAYLVATRNWAPKWWFVLMAQTEVEWWSNWASCGNGLGSGQITGGTDIAQIHICQSLDKTWTAGTCRVNTDECTYTNDNQLRYIVIY